MQPTTFASICGAALLSASSIVQAEISANIGVTSNYVWRGVTQTNDQAAIQGGLDFAHESGFYIGTWASNVDFDDDTQGGETEWDVYAGYGGEIGEFSYDIGYIHYFYPDTSDTDFGEIGLGVGYGPVSAGIQYTVYSAVEEEDGQADLFIEDDVYYYISASFDLPMGFSAGLTVGYYTWEDDGEGDYDLDYAHGQVDIGKSAGDFGDFTFSLSLAEDSDVTDDDVIPFVSWTKTFE